MEHENLNYQETAALIGVAIGTLYSWVSRGTLPHLRLGPRLVRFKKSEIQKWLNAHHVDAKEKRGAK